MDGNGGITFTPKCTDPCHCLHQKVAGTVLTAQSSKKEKSYTGIVCPFLEADNVRNDVVCLFFLLSITGL